MGRKAPKREEVERQLDRILASPDFQASDRLRDFLAYVVEETLSGRGKEIKGYTIATRVFDRPDDFDPSVDPIVRIQAGRLRRRLDAYYHTHGADDPVVIAIPKGRYVASFANRETGSSGAETTSYGSSISPINGEAARPTIAVLPFVTIGVDDESVFLADGITEELTVGFSRFMALAVISRQSTERYRDSIGNLDEVARELGIRFVVTGSVRRMGDIIRVAAQLTDAENSSQIWAETMERDLSISGLLELEDTITSSVLSCIADDYGAISRRLALESKAKAPTELSAYEATLTFYSYITTVAPGLHERAFEALQHAVKIDPDYALAWAQLAELYFDTISLGFNGPENALDLAHDCAHRAINLDPMCQQAHNTMAYVHFFYGEHDVAIASAERAIELNPNNAHMVATAAFWLGMCGQLERAAAIIDEAERLNPHQPGWLSLVSLLLNLDRQDYRGALDYARRFRSPAFAWGPLLRASTAALCGEDEYAVSSYREFEALFPEVEADPATYIKAFVHSEEHLVTLLSGLDTARELAPE